MPTVENISRQALKEGLHQVYRYDHDLLIQFSGHLVDFSVPRHPFEHVLLIECDDLEDPKDPWALQPSQAANLAANILTAFNAGRSILVQCDFGLSRSGAVVEICVQHGFQDVHTRRDPNKLIYRMLADLLMLPRIL